MEQNQEIREVIEIPVAERRYLNEYNSKLRKKFVITALFLPSFISLIILTIKFNYEINSTELQNIANNDQSILGHLPYKEISQDELVFIEPHIWVHKDMSKALLKMRQDAKKEGIYLVFLSGYRSIKLQEEIFYSLKSLRNQDASERARVSASPGYSEHSTGFAIEFDRTNAFRWLKKNAAKYHFKLSFDQHNKNIDYEPWHWRYEGSIEALKVFEASNRKMFKVNKFQEQ